MIIKLDDKREYDNIGEKAKSIMRLRNKGFCVPHGIILNEEFFYSCFLNEDIKNEIEEYLQILTSENVHNISEKIKSIIDKCNISSEKWNDVEILLKENIKYAVRSSSSKEDLDNFSFAGQYDTFLNVQGSYNIKDSVKKCYKSAFNSTALHYIVENSMCKNSKISVNDFTMSVLIQEMVEADISGVAFTINTITGNDKEIIMEFVKGNCEKLVSGKAVPEKYIYDWMEEKFIYKAENGFVSDDKIMELINTSIAVQQEYGYPCDIEFAFSKDRLYLLQARPITKICYTSFKEIWTNANFKDGGVSSTVCRPFMWSLYEYIWDDSLKNFLLNTKLWNKRDNEKLGDMFYGRPYWNLGAVKKVMKKVPGYVEKDFDDDLGITRSYKGNGVVIKPSLSVLFPFIKTVIAYNYIVLKRTRNFESIRENLMLKYYDYFNKMKEIKEYRDIEADWVKLIKDDYHLSESTYFTQVFINTIWQTLFKNKMLKYVSSEEYYKLISSFDNISHLRLHNELNNLCSKIKKDNYSYDYWKNTESGEIYRDYKVSKNQFYFTDLESCIDKYGYHSNRELDVSYPCYYEDIRAVINIVKMLLNNKEKDVEYSYEEYFLKLKKKLGRRKYKSLKKSTDFMRKLLWWREEFKDISTRYYFLIRMYTLKLAEKYEAEGIIKNSEDIWNLKINDITDFIENNIDAETLKYRAEKNKNYYRSFRNFSNPDELGMKNLDKDKKEQHYKVDLCGVGCSPGEVEGTARVVENVEDIDKIRKGEIVVTKFTDTGWTSRFSYFGGLITEHGGVLCHASIVAREYGIPCIVSAKNVMKSIKDGSTIYMNGQTGEIRIRHGDLKN